jgi:hypothetical protein
MKTILLPLALSLLVHGCATRPVLSGVTVKPLDDTRTVFRVRNESSIVLSNVSYSAWIGVAGHWEGTKTFKAGNMFPGEFFDSNRMNLPIQAIEIEGKCREGKFRAVWHSGDPLPEFKSSVLLPF